MRLGLEGGSMRRAPVGAVLLSDNVTTLPPLGAALDNVTVHVELPPDVTVVGVHCSAETTVEPTVTTLPVPAVVVKLPSGKAPITFVIGSETELLLVELSATVTTATTPLAIPLPLIPLATHVTDPLFGEQLSDLPAAVRAAPTVVLRETTSLVG